jgi:hypothetical protein
LFWDGVESQAYECIKLNDNIYNVEWPWLCLS